jgi:hypothetical protein
MNGDERDEGVDWNDARTQEIQRRCSGAKTWPRLVA